MRFMIMAVAFAVVPGFSYAACSDDADALAHKYGITASLASPATPASSETLAKTGGVIAPPPTGDRAAVTPAMPNTDSMQTAPSLPPQTAEGKPVDKIVRSERNAATDAQAASLLQAARQAGLKGDETTCMQRLGDARTLLEKTPAQSQ